jgi:uncharacterized membrane protein YccC
LIGHGRPAAQLCWRLRSLRIPTLRDLVFSAKAYLAAAVALFIGFSQGLEKPYWAVLTIYSVLTPLNPGRSAPRRCSA